MFAGLLYCADCGHALTYSQKKRTDGTHHGAYSCWMYKTHGKEYCASPYITYDTVYNLVLEDIRRNISYLIKCENEFKSRLGEKYQSKSQADLKKLKAEYDRNNRRCLELEKILCRLYEDNVLGKISDSRYEIMSSEYEKENQELKSAQQKIAIRIEAIDAAADNADKFLKVIRKYILASELNAAMLNELIDKIIVHHKEKASSGETVQQIEIFYRFIGTSGACCTNKELQLQK